MSRVLLIVGLIVTATTLSGCVVYERGEHPWWGWHHHHDEW